MLNLFNSNNEQIELMETDDYEVGTNVFKIGNLAVVFIKKEFIGVAFVKNGNSYRAIIENVIDFPVSFIENPTTIISTGSDSDYAYCSVVGVLRTLNGISQVTLDRSSEINGTRLTLQILAIGRYK